MNKKLLSFLLCGVFTVGATTFASCENTPSTSVGGSEQQTPSEEELAGAEGLKCSETFVGKLSEKAYESPIDAVNAFVANELSGENNLFSVQDYKTKKLSAAEISALTLPNEIADRISYVEEATVYYTLSTSVKSMSVGQDECKSARFYLVVADGKIYYFSALPKTGEPLTKSYFDSVNAYENYKNCTVTFHVQIQTEDNEYKHNEEEGMIMKITENEVYATSLTQSEDPNLYSHAYMQFTNKGYTQYYSHDGITWEKGSTFSESFHEFLNMMPLLFFYYSFTYPLSSPDVLPFHFEKTNTGFCLNLDAFIDYIRFLSLISDGYYDDLLTANLDGTNGYYYVSDGMIVRGFANFQYQEIGGSYFGRIFSEFDVTDIGTTTLDGLNLPAE